MEGLKVDQVVICPGLSLAVGRVVVMVTWESPEITMKALEGSVCSLVVPELMTIAARNALAEGGM